MIERVTESEFVDRFVKIDRENNFTYWGRVALFEYFQELEDDIGESTNRASEYPDIVAQLMDHVEWARKDIGDYDRIGENARFFDPEPRRPDIKNGERF